MKFYLAGKMAGAKWREDFPDADVFEFVLSDGFPVTPLGIGNHEMVGPSFLECGHGSTCNRWENDHGAALDSGGCASGEFSREEILSFCLDAIRRCDVFFAWLDDLTCYGTLTEIGFARGLGKPIWIAGPPEFVSNDREYYGGHGATVTTDLWFACTMADRVLPVVENTHPREALRQLIKGPETREERRARITGELVTVSR